jgi:protein-tyrosine phosphatase
VLVQKSKGNVGAPVHSGTVLLVCRANAARTPLAAALLRRRLADRGATRVKVLSAGTETSAATMLQPEAQQVAEGRGLDLSRHVIRGVDEELVQRADLVVTMTESLRDQLARTWPSALGRIFTLVELERLLARVPGPFLDLSELATRAHASRPVTPPASSAEDIEDPVGRSVRFYERTADQLDRLVTKLAGHLGTPDL